MILIFLLLIPQTKADRIKIEVEYPEDKCQSPFKRSFANRDSPVIPYKASFEGFKGMYAKLAFTFSQLLFYTFDLESGNNLSVGKMHESFQSFI